MEVMGLSQQVAELDKPSRPAFATTTRSTSSRACPARGVILGAEFLATAGGDMTTFGTADRLADFGGVTPLPRDSGKISGSVSYSHARRKPKVPRRSGRVPGCAGVVANDADTSRPRGTAAVDGRRSL